MESARLIAGLARMVRDVGLAEELAQDALVIALEKWPVTGVPDNPGAWLMATAKHRAIDRLRRSKLQQRKHEEMGHELEREWQDATAALESRMDDDIGDDLLQLVFTACHPLLSMDARVALTLRLLCGLSTNEIARAYLVAESTVAQRIVRAKRTLSEAQVPFEVPRGNELHERIASVLSVIYLVFNEGYTATAGDDLMRPALCEEALRLGRIVAELTPAEPEVHGLVALMEIQASRARAHRQRWQTGTVAGTGSCTVGQAAGRARLRCAGPRLFPARCSRPVCAAGRNRRLPCTGCKGRRHRLAYDRGLV